MSRLEKTITIYCCFLFVAYFYLCALFFVCCFVLYLFRARFNLAICVIICCFYCVNFFVINFDVFSKKLPKETSGRFSLEFVTIFGNLVQHELVKKFQKKFLFMHY